MRKFFRNFIGKIESFCFYNINKCRLNLIKSTFKYKPYDYSFMLNVLKQMAIYNEFFYKSDYCYSVGNDLVARDMKLIAKLVDILNEEHQLFTYFDGMSPLKYKCLVKVNTTNCKRFTNNTKLIDEYPHELYLIKARYLLSKLIYYRLPYWWD